MSEGSANLTIREREALAETYGMGLDLLTAASAKGINAQRLRRILASDPQLREQLIKARLKDVADGFEVIRKAAASDSRAAAWLRRRRDMQDLGAWEQQALAEIAAFLASPAD